jgi:hypothetical protein
MCSVELALQRVAQNGLSSGTTTIASIAAFKLRDRAKRRVHARLAALKSP